MIPLRRTGTIGELHYAHQPLLYPAYQGSYDCVNILVCRVMDWTRRASPRPRQWISRTLMATARHVMQDIRKESSSAWWKITIA